MLPQIEALLLSCDGRNAGADTVPISPFMEHVWRLHNFRQQYPLDDPAARARYVYYFVDTFWRSRAPYRPVVPREVMDWLSAPVLDLDCYFSEEPTPNGLRRRPCRRFLPRYMLYLWNALGRTVDIFSPYGYYEFLVWFAAEATVEFSLPVGLMPQAIVDLFNYPAINSTHPLSVGLFSAARKKNPERFAEDTGYTREDILAASFEGLSWVARSGDARLLPEYVTSFWSTRPFLHIPTTNSAESFLTSFEYVTAASRPDESGVTSSFLGFTEQQNNVRQWMRSRPGGTELGSLLLSGGLVRAEERVKTHQGPVSPSEIVMFRERELVAGLGTAAQATMDSLTGSGYSVQELDFALGRHRTEAEAAFNEGQPISSGRQLHVFAFNPEYIPECVASNIARFKSGDYLVAQPYWELSSICSVHECGLDLMDELWVASEYLREIYAKYTDKPVLNMKQAVVIPPLFETHSRQDFGIPEDAFTFLMSFDSRSSILRKNPLGAVRAFQKAFPESVRDVMLVIKTRFSRNPISPMDGRDWQKVREIARVDARIQIIDGTLSGQELLALKRSADAFVSLHRSEGFGYGPAEAMALGKPVIVTNYSAVTDFCNFDTAMLVNYSIADVPEGAYPFMDEDRLYQWAEPDLSSAETAFRALYDDRALARRLGETGRALIQSEYSVEALGRRLSKRLAELGFHPSGTPKFLQAALAAGGHDK